MSAGSISSACAMARWPRSWRTSRAEPQLEYSMNTSDVLKYGQLTFLAGLRGLPESEWETPGVCGYWSVKQIIAHIASYEAALADILRSLTGSGPTPTLDRFLVINRGFNEYEGAAPQRRP